MIGAGGSWYAETMLVTLVTPAPSAPSAPTPPSAPSAWHRPPRAPRVVVPAVVTAAVVALLGSAGCRFGEAHFDSTLPGRSFDPAGTVLTYEDEHDDALVIDDNPRVVVAMTWIIFDPNGDLNDLEGSALADYSHELKLRDALALVFDELGDIEAGATFESIVIGGEESGPGGFTARVHLAPERLDADSTYAGVVPIASKRTTKVEITAANLVEGSPALAGDVTITFERTEDDPGEAREGAFTGSFLAPLAEERTAEQNLGLLDVEDVLGLPLPPRPEPPAGDAP